MLKPVRMKKFYVRVPRTHETLLLEEIGKLGVVQLIGERAAIGEEPENIELYNSFVRMCERSTVLIKGLQAAKDKLMALLPEHAGELTSSHSVPLKAVKATQEEIIKYIEAYEGKLDGLARRIDSLQREADELGAAKDHLLLLRENGVDLDSIGDHKFMFVKIGLINNTFVPKLDGYMKDFRVVYKTMVINPRESSLLIAAPSEFKQNVERALSLLNFNEFTFPPHLPSNPSSALDEVKKIARSKLEEIIQLEGLLGEMLAELEARRKYVSFLREAKPSLLRTRSFCVVEGWVPEHDVERLRNVLSHLNCKELYFGVEDPREDEKVPVELSNKGVLKNFELLTSVRGTPSYKDVDPTLIYAIFFPIMYGMMFGDIGDGLLILIWGLLFYRRNKPFLGISKRVINRLGVIMMTGGLSAMVFGAFYGSIFLYEGIRPLLLKPTESFYTIMGISLLFGVIQIIIALALNVTNNILEGEVKEAILGGKGLFGLIYYVIGVVLAYKLILGGLQFPVFLSPENVPLTVGALIMLLLIFLSPTIKGLRSHDFKIGEGLMEGFGEFIETFISYITNSMSYIRLAAFAIAHGILAEFAHALGGSMGVIPSLLLVNVMVIFIEGFAAGIQSIRLMYYEFSTKFFTGGGTRFNPLKLLLE
ncbi:MAG: V-type ATP synthase subunit I [Nitrososphaeria archaeon]